MNNFWELYENEPGFAAATIALDAAWNEAKLLAPGLPSKDRARLAEKHVYAVMQKLSGVGAMDTEPVAHLRWLVRQHFGTEGGYV